jgi:hypothetical protein
VIEVIEVDHYSEVTARRAGAVGRWSRRRKQDSVGRLAIADGSRGFDKHAAIGAASCAWRCEEANVVPNVVTMAELRWDALTEPLRTGDSVAEGVPPVWDLSGHLLPVSTHHQRPDGHHDKNGYERPTAFLPSNHQTAAVARAAGTTGTSTSKPSSRPQSVSENAGLPTTVTHRLQLDIRASAQ